MRWEGGRELSEAGWREAEQAEQRGGTERSRVGRVVETPESRGAQNAESCRIARRS